MQEIYDDTVWVQHLCMLLIAFYTNYPVFLAMSELHLIY